MEGILASTCVHVHVHCIYMYIYLHMYMSCVAWDPALVMSCLPSIEPNYMYMYIHPFSVHESVFTISPSD